jgi:hypothetical protein
MKTPTGVEIPNGVPQPYDNDHSWVVQINGQWYRIEEESSRIVLGGNPRRRPGSSDGTRHEFKMYTYRNPVGPLPNPISKFIKKHLKDGSTTGHLVVLRKGVKPPKEKAFRSGWVS